MSEENEESFIPYEKREEWNDIEPCPQNDGPEPVVPIAYTENFKSIMDYFRAILRKKEYSERALQLTKDAIDANPANYSAWKYRRECLEHLKKDLREELNYLNEIIMDNQKNYQVWYHRMVILERYQKVDASELKFISLILNEDSKNYHCWAHRQWVIKKFNLWDEEIAFTEHMLKQDFRNNSAWNHRFFVIKHLMGTAPADDNANATTTTTAESSNDSKNALNVPIKMFNLIKLGDDVRVKEIEFAFNHLKKSPNNESGWNYAHGMASYHDGSNKAFDKLQELTELVLEKVPINGHAHWVLLECLLYRIQKGLVEDIAKSYEQAVHICENLIKFDGIRAKYWQFRKNEILSQQQNSTSAMEK